jgi:nucleolar MIF4G domain-containing protein 1
VSITLTRQEKRYNPYYTLILNNLCAESYDHRFTLQYALWDFLRELGGTASKETRRRSLNVAKAMAYVIARGTMDLTVFKVSPRDRLSVARANEQAVEWAELNSATNSFLAFFLVHLVLSTQTVSPLFTLPKSYRTEAMDVEAVEEAFEKSLSDSKLASGWSIVLRMELGQKKIEKVLEHCGIAGAREVDTVTAGLDLGRAVVARGL